ncbi:TetR/AcrR family transcriptional regulator [Amycolatopsis regifaucium]|uniref:TetR family transcriptional regulator n=1 Tax=Amycolatopsis regifaucium TaxID=546365 RepID=A0A154ML13_9PSEU|nr:TetR/AcrR family transcriptional regulator [Amycolatopsis regifaucium]KZB84985.1 TetR family transcriptional regulator [Amycolatopsis regifaucium]OKA04004.1 TetR family transcriptional regulator [Amycolatopsis regifaucium]SFH98206.1 DNA-binding transcriptional regulator, AcrR family [Amycolatopsis regifaucium]
MARPRTITDERLLKAAETVIGMVGPGFTLAQVAAEAGVAVGSVAQRFGSKNGLLQALSRLNTRTVVERMRDCGELADPVEGLRAAIVVVYEGLGTPETAANHLGQLGVDIGDPELRALLGEHFTAVEAELRRLMRVAARDLPGAPGVVRAARVLLGVTNGAALDWSIRPKGRFVDRVGQDVDAVLTAWKGSVRSGS